MLSFLHSPSLLSSSLTPLFESVYHFYLSIHPPFLHPFLSRHINIHQSFHLSTLHLLFSAQFVRAIHSSLLLSSLLPGTCPHAFQLDPSFLSTFLISSSFLYTFYTSLHLNPSWWSLPLHPPLYLSLSSMLVYGLPVEHFLPPAGTETLAGNISFFLYSKWKSHTGNTWQRPFLLDSN